MNPPILIIIPSCGRVDLLDRTLRSVADCERAPTLRSVVVVENGSASGAWDVVARFTSVLPMQYYYVTAANKSRALNQVLAKCSDEFLIFLDDDVRVRRQTLLAYARALGERTHGAFYGGRCFVDYEQPPPLWMKRYLPPSAIGWSLGEHFRRFDKPCALGFNWGAFACDLKAVGGFNEKRGPGTLSRGQETDMQERLLAAGVFGFYVPDAMVWHFVPAERCSPAWALERAEQTAVYSGVDLASKRAAKRLCHAVLCQLKALSSTACLAIFCRLFPAQKKFYHEYRKRWNLGILKGLRLSRQ